MGLVGVVDASASSLLYRICDFAGQQGVKCMIEKSPLAKVGDAVQHTESRKVRFGSVVVMEYR